MQFLITKISLYIIKIYRLMFCRNPENDQHTSSFEESSEDTKVTTETGSQGEGIAVYNESTMKKEDHVYAYLKVR